MKTKDYQFVWCGKWIGFHFLTFTGMMSGIYKWVLQFGFFEIRRWR